MFKYISYLEFWWPFLFIFGRGHFEDYFCEIILNFDRWFRRRCHFKTFLILSSGDPLFTGSGVVLDCIDS